MAHVQFCHPWINLWLLLAVLKLARTRAVSFHRLRVHRVPLALLALVSAGFRAPLRVSLCPESQQRAAAVAEGARVLRRAAGDHGYLWSRRQRSIRVATQATFHLLPFGGGRGDGTSKYPAHIDTLKAAGRAPGKIETKHCVGRSCLACLPEIAAVNIRAHFQQSAILSFLSCSGLRAGCCAYFLVFVDHCVSL